MWSAHKIKSQININEMYSLFEYKYEKDYSFPGETHNFWECLYVIEGELFVSGDERVYTLFPGDIIFHKPLEMHKFTVVGEEGAHLFIFSFSCTGELTDFLKNKVFQLNDEQRDIVFTLLDYLRKKTSDTPLHTEVLSKYMQLFETGKNYSQRIALYISQLFLCICDDNAESIVSDTDEAKIFKNAINYMNEFICSQPSVDSIAEFCGISKTGLKRIFSKYAGFGVHKYFLKLKINTAAQLLCDGLNVTETSEKLGFGNQAYFSFVFKRETGQSPTQYLKSVRH